MFLEQRISQLEKRVEYLEKMAVGDETTTSNDKKENTSKKVYERYDFGDSKPISYSPFGL